MKYAKGMQRRRTYQCSVCLSYNIHRYPASVMDGGAMLVCDECAHERDHLDGRADLECKFCIAAAQNETKGAERTR